MDAPPNPLYFLIDFPLLWFAVTMILLRRSKRLQCRVGRIARRKPQQPVIGLAPNQQFSALALTA
jgi:hypothetical protein